MTAQKPRNKITQQDVARLAGVSVAAVSQVLGGKGRISPEGVRRVYQAIDQLGYRHGMTNTPVSPARIGILLPPGCAFCADLLPALAQTLQQASFILCLCYSQSHPAQLLAHGEQLLAQDVRGILVCGNLLSGAPEALQALSARCEARRVALIGVSEYRHPGPVSAIRPDNAQAAHMATDALLHKQHQNVAYLGGESHSLVRAERLGGLSVALGKAGVAFSPSLSQTCAATFDDASRAVVLLLKQHPKISAILCDNPAVLLAVHHVLASGLQTPKWRWFSRRIALTGFGTCEHALKLKLPLIAAGHEAIAHRAVECLQMRLAGHTLLPDDPQLTVPPAFLSFSASSAF